MKNKCNIFNFRTLLFLSLIVSMFNACDNKDSQTFDKTRLFRPVLNEELYAEGNTIIVNMGSLKEAVGYTLEVSRDTFATIEYTILSDVSYVEINANTVGEELFWNTLYQVRATAHASEPEFDSKVADLGNVRTERFPTILNVPSVSDVTDVGARVTWTVLGAPVTGIKVFAASDLKLTTPLFDETPVTAEQQEAGESFVFGLSPETEYQIAIYSGSDLRGWVNYTTLTPDIDTSLPNVIDLSDSEDRTAVETAVASANDGDIILVKRGVEYDAPGVSLNKSLTIRAAYGFGEQKARLLFPGNFDLDDGSNVDHLRFIDLELRGTDWGGKYVINISKAATLNEFSIDNCYVTNFRGIFRQKDNPSVVNNYIINNSVVDSINGYGVATCDKDTAILKNIMLTNSTFNRTIYFLASRNNSESVLIENCTMANINESGRQMLRWRGGDGKNNITNGVVIKNSIIGHCWDKSESGVVSIRGREGLDNTLFDISNTYTVSDFSWTSNPIEALPVGNANSSQDDLWEDPENNNFNIKDSGFPGKYDTGDPRWRVQL
ncbi:DUF5123 domain-containing protein [Tamlana flava]|uniref:DUF5123 domain-containing protein n=1 Tax=Tamlana flava TaxID=3158572 RepID=UPI00351AFD2A